jgi:hypothetical protein
MHLMHIINAPNMEYGTSRPHSFIYKTRLFNTVSFHQPAIDPYPAPDLSTPLFHAVFLQGNQHVRGGQEIKKWNEIIKKKHWRID